MIICIAHRVCNKCNKETDDYKRCRTTQVRIHHGCDQLFVGLHIEAEPELIEPLKNRIVENESEKAEKVDDAY